MNPDPRSGQPLRSAGIAIICFGAGSLAFLCTAGVALYFAVIAIAGIAQHEPGQQVVRLEDHPEGPLLLLAVGLATILLDALLVWTGIRMLRGHPGAPRLACIAAVVGLIPAAGVLALVLGVRGYESGWLIVAGVWFHALVGIGLAANFYLDPNWKRWMQSRSSPTTGSAARSTS